MRQDHPLVQLTLNKELIRQYPHIALYVADREELIGGQVLAKELFESDKGILETSHLLTAFEILRETDYLLICPAYLARNEGATRDIVALTLPVDLTFSVHTRSLRIGVPIIRLCTDGFGKKLSIRFRRCASAQFIAAKIATD